MATGRRMKGLERFMTCRDGLRSLYKFPHHLSNDAHAASADITIRLLQASSPHRRGVRCNGRHKRSAVRPSLVRCIRLSRLFATVRFRVPNVRNIADILVDLRSLEAPHPSEEVRGGTAWRCHPHAFSPQAGCSPSAGYRAFTPPSGVEAQTTVRTRRGKCRLTTPTITRSCSRPCHKTSCGAPGSNEIHRMDVKNLIRCKIFSIKSISCTVLSTFGSWRCRERSLAESSG